MTPKRNPDDFSSSETKGGTPQTPTEKEEERRKIRRLQLMIDTALSIVRQAPNLTLQDATGMVANCKSAALAMFPDKEFAFDLIYKPRFERVLAERFKNRGIARDRVIR